MSTEEFDPVRANALFVRGEYRAAFECCFHGATVCKSPLAAADLAFMYHIGAFGPRNYFMARKFYLAASSLETGEPEYNLALLFLRGLGIPPSGDTAARYMKTSAAKGCMEAQLYLGVAYTLGKMFDPIEIECLSLIPYHRIVKRRLTALTGHAPETSLFDPEDGLLEADGQDACEMLEAAVAHTDTTYLESQIADARLALGQALIEGLGATYDPRRGFRLIQRAALENGSPEAAAYLAAHREQAAAYGIDARKTAYLLAADKPNK